jgi:gluconate kinase
MLQPLENFPEADSRTIAPWCAMEFLVQPSIVVACSALNRSYRELLAQGDLDVQFFHLLVEFDLIKRLNDHQDPFTHADLPECQFQML